MNQLKVDLKIAILALAARQWSKRKIARELKIDRKTVDRYWPVEESKAAIPPAGSESAEVSNASISPPGSSASAAGRKSNCEPLRQLIEAKLALGLSAQRIYQDLVTDQGLKISYDSVKRFVRGLEKVQELPFRRMEVAPGEQAQVDFGLGAWVLQEGKRRRPHLFRLVLSCSRKGYTEAVWRQTTEGFLRCLENAFCSLGGVPATVVIDNLSAAVQKADWYDPQLNPKIRSFAEHYGVVILPTKPAMPRHKGKVEAGVKYAQNNGVKGRQFDSLNAQNQFLLDWEKRVADTRIHGTIRQQVGPYFESVEKSALQPLPPTLFPTFEEGHRKVHRDGYVEVERSYYSVPPEYMGRKVVVRWEPRLVRIFNHRMEQIALHARAEPGRFSTDQAHIHNHKRCVIEQGPSGFWIEPGPSANTPGPGLRK